MSAPGSPLATRRRPRAGAPGRGRELRLDLRRAGSLLAVAASVGAMVARRPGPAPREAGQRLRRMLADLGPSFVKAGQFLANRVDLLPAEVCQELGGLFDDVAPLPFDAVRATIEAELGRPLGEIFLDFHRQPVASASIAQVHEAWTPQGRVAVKVQRPGIERLFASDLRNLRRLAWLADLLRLAPSVSFTRLVDDFADWTLREFDFVQEAAATETFRLSAQTGERIPRIDPSRSTRRVLTMEYIDGSTLARLADLRRFGGPAAVDRALPGVDLAAAFHILAFATFRRMFDHGRFHADLHPGNIILAPDGGVGIVDHGVVGRLTPRQRELAEAYYGQLAIGNVAATVACLSQLWTPADGADAGGFENDLKRIVRDWRRLITTPGAPVEAAHWGRFSDQVFAAARLRGYTADLGLVLFFRAIAQLHSCFILFSLDFVRELQAFMQPRQLTWRGPDGSLEASLDWIRKEVDAQRRTVGQVAALAAAPPPLVQAAARRSERQVRDETRRAKVLTLSLITVSVAVALSGRLA